MTGRGIFARWKQLFTLERRRDSERELDPYRHEFAPNDPVLTEISEAVRAREAAAQKDETQRDSSAA
jgi:hypothetical protein